MDGWQKVHPGTTPTLPEIQAIQGWAYVESRYGGWANHKKCGNNGVGSNNWGSVQKCKPCTEPGAYCCKNLDGQCPEGTFQCGDYDASHNANYSVCFLKYATPADGAAGIIKNMTSYRKKTWAAIKTGNAEAIATAMYDEKYYGGFGATREIRIEGGIKALTEATTVIAKALGEEQVVKRGGGTPPAQSGTSDGDTSSSSGIVAFGVLAFAAAAGGIWLASRKRLPRIEARHASAWQPHLSRGGRR